MRLAWAALALVMCGGGTPVKGPGGRVAPPRAPSIIPGSLDASILLGDVPQRATAAGAGPVSLVGSGELVEGERLGAFVQVPADQCLLGYARVSSSLDDADVTMYSDEGDPIAADEAPDAHPTVMLCPPHPDRVYLSVHAAGGEGLVALAAQLVPRDKALDVAKLVGARGGRGVVQRAADAWPGLDDQVRTHQAALGGTWQEIRKVAVAVDARSSTTVPMPVEADRCTDALVVPDDDVSLLDVEVMDDGGRTIARGKEGTKERYITLCSPIAINATLAIRPHNGSGVVAVVLAKTAGDAARDLSTRTDIVWYAATQTVAQAKTGLDAELVKAGYAPAVQSSSGSITTGKRSKVSFDPIGGGCARIDVVAGAPLALVAAKVYDDKGSLLASGEGGLGSTIFSCGAGKMQLELEARGRPGPYGIYVRKEKWQSNTFAQHPLAASRMLARAAQGSFATFDGTALTVREYSVDAQKKVTWDTQAAAGTCLRIAAGADGEGTGLVLYATDATSGEDIDRSHGQRSALIRACATPSAPLKIRCELVTTSGKLEVLIGERTTK